MLTKKEKYKLTYQVNLKWYDAGIAEGKEELKKLWINIPTEHTKILQGLQVYV